MSLFGKRHPSYMTKEGYQQIYCPSSPSARPNGYAPKHRVKAEQKLGRPLHDYEVVHHINGKKNDNRKCNLAVMTREEHFRVHKK